MFLIRWIRRVIFRRKESAITEINSESPELLAAIKAKTEAQKKLEKAKMDQFIVEAVNRESQALQRSNNFGKALDQAFRKAI